MTFERRFTFEEAARAYRITRDEWDALAGDPSTPEYEQAAQARNLRTIEETEDPHLRRYYTSILENQGSDSNFQLRDLEPIERIQAPPVAAQQVHQTEGTVPGPNPVEAIVSAIQSQEPLTGEALVDNANYTYQLAKAVEQGALPEEMHEDALALVAANLQVHGEQLRPHLQVIDQQWVQENAQLFETPEPGVFGKILGGVATVGGFLDQWGVGVRQAIAGVREGTKGEQRVSDEEALRQFFSGLVRAFDPTQVIPDHSLTDYLEGQGIIDRPGEFAGGLNLQQNDDGFFSLGEALGKTAEGLSRKERIPYFVAEFIAEALLDPTTYLTGGTARSAQVTMNLAQTMGRELASEGVEYGGRKITTSLVDSLNQKIQRRGLSSLSERDLDVYRYILTEARDRVANSPEVAEHLARLTEGGRTGVRLAGTIPTLPTGRLGDVGRASGLLNDVPYETVVRDGVEQVVAGPQQLGLLSGRIRQASQPLVRRLSPRSRLATELGRRQADELGAALSETRRNPFGAEVETRLGLGEADGIQGRGLEAIAEHTSGDPHQFVYRALTDEDYFNAVQGSALMPQEAKDYLQVLHDVRVETRNMEIAAGADPAKLRDVWDYVPFVSNGVEVPEEGLAQAGRKTGGGAVDEDFLGARSDFVNKATDPVHANQMAREVFGQDLFIENPGEAFVRRAEAAGSRSSDMQLLDRLSAVDAQGFDRMTSLLPADALDEARQVERVALFDDALADPETAERVSTEVAAGRVFELILGDAGLDDVLAAADGPLSPTLAKITEAAEKASRFDAKTLLEAKMRREGMDPNNYTALPLPQGGLAAVHNAVYDELVNIRRLGTDPRKISLMREVLDMWVNTAAAHATVGIINLPFHARNAGSNVVLTFLGGLTDPRRFADALNYQRALAQAKGIMESTGKSQPAAIRQAFLDAGMTPQDVTNVIDAIQTGVLDSTLVSELLRSGADEFVDPGRQRVLFGRGSERARLSPFNTDSLWIKPGRAVGQALENNARLALYLDQITKGADPSSAAVHVKKYLFDYGDTTRFENEAVRQVMRFYTFRRKNLGAFFDAMIYSPGRVRQALRGTEALEKAVAGDDDGDPDHIPMWFRGATIGGDGTVVEVENPIEDALEIGALPLEIARIVSTDDADRLIAGDPERSTQIVRLINEQIGSSLMGLSEIYYETATEADAYFGHRRARGYDETWEDDLKNNVFYQVANNLVPSIGRALKYRQDGSALLTQEDEANLILFTMLAGIKTDLIDPDQSEAWDVRDSNGALIYQLRKMGAAGVDVDSIDDLREQGLAPIKDRILTHLAYRTTSDGQGNLTFRTEEDYYAFLSIIPKSVREEMGLPVELPEGAYVGRGASPEVEEDTPEYEAQQTMRVEEMLTALSFALERDLTEAEIIDLAVVTGGLSDKSLEYSNINPDTGNVFDPEDAPLSFEERQAEGRAEVGTVLARYGLSPERVAQLRPLLSEGQKVLADAAEAGVSDAELVAYLQGDALPRTLKGKINLLFSGDHRFGPAGELDMFKLDRFDSEDEYRLARRTLDRMSAAQLLLTLQGHTLRTPAAQWIALDDGLNTRDQTIAGVPVIEGPPSREDVTPPEQQGTLAARRYQAILEGLGQ